MELKDVILSTLAEMEVPIEDEKPQIIDIPEKKAKLEKKIEDIEDILETQINREETASTHKITETELIYLESIKERLLVLFEGFQSPNNLHIETKVDITLNFLEYILSTIELRINSLEKEDK